MEEDRRGAEDRGALEGPLPRPQDDRRRAESAHGGAVGVGQRRAETAVGRARAIVGDELPRLARELEVGRRERSPAPHRPLARRLVKRLLDLDEPILPDVVL